MCKQRKLWRLWKKYKASRVFFKNHWTAKCWMEDSQKGRDVGGIGMKGGMKGRHTLALEELRLTFQLSLGLGWDLGEIQLMMATGNARVTVSKWYSHETSPFMTTLLRDERSDANCHRNWRATCNYPDICSETDVARMILQGNYWLVLVITFFFRGWIKAEEDQLSFTWYFSESLQWQNRQNRNAEGKWSYNEEDLAFN